MNEYMIEVLTNNEVTHIVNREHSTKKISVVILTETNVKYSTKFRSRETAQKIAKNVNGARVVPYYGGIVNSSKTSVAPKDNKVNRSTPYRTI